jgi:hypothetical protein
MKGYTVFNVEQIEGLPAHYYAKAEPHAGPAQRIAHAEGFFEATGAISAMAATSAYYAPGPDRADAAFRVLPQTRELLRHPACMSTHWTRHPSRLDREFGRKRWGDEGYAMEELVAELGSAFLSADLGLTPEPARIMPPISASWLKVSEGGQAGDLHRPPRATRSAPPISCTACNQKMDLVMKCAKDFADAVQKELPEASEKHIEFLLKATEDELLTLIGAHLSEGSDGTLKATEAPNADSYLTVANIYAAIAARTGQSEAFKGLVPPEARSEQVRSVLVQSAPDFAKLCMG